MNPLQWLIGVFFRIIGKAPQVYDPWNHTDHHPDDPAAK